MKLDDLIAILKQDIPEPLKSEMQDKTLLYNFVLGGMAQSAGTEEYERFDREQKPYIRGTLSNVERNIELFSTLKEVAAFISGAASLMGDRTVGVQPMPERLVEVTTRNREEIQIKLIGEHEEIYTMQPNLTLQQASELSRVLHQTMATLDMGGAFQQMGIKYGDKVVMHMGESGAEPKEWPLRMLLVQYNMALLKGSSFILPQADVVMSQPDGETSYLVPSAAAADTIQRLEQGKRDGIVIRYKLFSAEESEQSMAPATQVFQRSEDGTMQKVESPTTGNRAQRRSQKKRKFQA